MAEFYDELFNVEDIPDYDVDVCFPDGTSVEMYLPTQPKVGDILKGFVIEKIEISKDYKDGEFYGRIILKRRKE
jgi:hypothetical protein